MWKWAGGFSNSAASFGPPEYFSCAWEKTSLPACLPVFCFLWVRHQPGEVLGSLAPFSSWPMSLVQDGEQLAPFSLQGKSKAVWGTLLLLFCPPNCLFFVKPSFKLGCTTSRGGHIQTHTQRPRKVHTGSATLQVKRTSKIVRTAEVGQHWLGEGLRGEIILCEGMLEPTKYTGDSGIMTGWALRATEESQNLMSRKPISYSILGVSLMTLDWFLWLVIVLVLANYLGMIGKLNREKNKKEDLFLKDYKAELLTWQVQ